MNGARPIFATILSDDNAIIILINKLESKYHRIVCSNYPFEHGFEN